MLSEQNKKFILKLLLFFFVSSNFLLIIKDNLLKENSVLSIVIIYGFLYLILIFQMIFLILVNKFSNKLFNFFLVLVLFYNLYSLNISLSSEFTVLEGKDKVRNLGIYFVIYLFLIFVFLKNTKVLKLVVIAYAAFNIFYLFEIQNLLNSFFYKKNYQVEFIKDKFKKKPNLYIYSIESLMSEDIVQNHLKVEKSLYMDALKDSNFIIFDNHFSDDYSTRNSLNSLLSIDQSIWKKNKKDYFTGKENSPFFDILRKNNYKIFTGFHDSHFGAPGKYVDGHYTFRSIKLENKFYQNYYVNYCQFKMPWYHLQLFNYCEFLKFIFKIDETQKLRSAKDFEKYIFSFINKENDYNKFVVFHQLTHSHPTPGTKNWRNQFIKSREKTVNIINQLVQKVKINDPNSILIIIGDHGPSLLKLSTEKEFHKNILQTYSNNEKLSYVIDRFYTVGAIYDNSSICNNYLIKLKNKKFTTNSMLLNSVLQCLFEEEQFTSSNLEYLIPGYKNTPLEAPEKYENYLFYK